MSKILSLLALSLTIAAMAAVPASAAVKPLPRDFLWGVSSSAFQSEGHTTNNNWNFYIRRDDGPHPVDKPKDPYGNSVDFFQRYRGDIARAAGLGVNTYRISINWARVEPRRGVFSKAGLRFYDRVFAAMARLHIQPLITLNHWDYPMWVYRQHGWANRRTADDFAAMTKVIAQRYAKTARYWLTFNEEFFFEFIEAGNHPLTAAQTGAMRANLIAAHKRAYAIIHRAPRGHGLQQLRLAGPGRSPASTPSRSSRRSPSSSTTSRSTTTTRPTTSPRRCAAVAGTPWNIPLDPFGMYTRCARCTARSPSCRSSSARTACPPRTARRAPTGSRARRTCATRCTGCSAPAGPACR